MKNSILNYKPLTKNNNGRSAPLAQQGNAIYIVIPRMTKVAKKDIPRNPIHYESGVTENRRVAAASMQRGRITVKSALNSDTPMIGMCNWVTSWPPEPFYIFSKMSKNQSLDR